VADCPYGCPPDDPERQCVSCRERVDPPVETRPVPLVTLPLGATRERVVGTLSVADALDGDASFDPGLLARANRGVLYIDEVNLLDDHLVDVLLDAAASGVNRVERDGVSRTHPAEFTLVGTMNPEEGDLRPQLRDRFALQATVTGCEAVEDRVAVIDRALDRNDDPEGFATAYEAETDALRERLCDARRLVDDVTLPEEFKADIAELCRDAGVDGHRADIATARTARTLAALDGRTKVLRSDIREAATFALPHRLRRRPFDDEPDPDDVLDDHFDDEDEGDGSEGDGEEGNADGDGEGDGERGGADGDGDGESGTEDAGDGDGPEDEPGDGDRRSDGDGDDGPDDGPAREPTPSGADPSGSDDGDGGDGDGEDSDGDTDADEEATPLVPGQRRAEVGDAASPPVDEVTASTGEGSGSRACAEAAEGSRGSRVRTERADPGDDVDPAASVRAAAAAGRTKVGEEDLRRSVRRGTAGTLVVFVVDASASMRPAMREAKGTVMALLRDAYERRDEVAFVAVAGDAAEVLLPPTDSVTLAARHLKQLPTGDRTPLPDGLDTATRLVTRSDADAGLVVVVTDGRANVAEGSPTAATRAAAGRLAESDASVVLVDAGDGGAGVTGVIEAETGGRRIPLSELTADVVADAAASADDA